MEALRSGSRLRVDARGPAARRPTKRETADEGPAGRVGKGYAQQGREGRRDVRVVHLGHDDPGPEAASPRDERGRRRRVGLEVAARGEATRRDDRGPARVVTEREARTRLEPEPRLRVGRDLDHLLGADDPEGAALLGLDLEHPAGLDRRGRVGRVDERRAPVRTRQRAPARDAPAAAPLDEASVGERRIDPQLRVDRRDAGVPDDDDRGAREGSLLVEAAREPRDLGVDLGVRGLRGRAPGARGGERRCGPLEPQLHEAWRARDAASTSQARPTSSASRSGPARSDWSACGLVSTAPRSGVDSCSASVVQRSPERVTATSGSSVWIDAPTVVGQSKDATPPPDSATTCHSVATWKRLACDARAARTPRSPRRRSAGIPCRSGGAPVASVACTG